MAVDPLINHGERRYSYDESILAGAAALCFLPPLQIFVYGLPDVGLHGRLCVVREPFKRGNLPGKQIGWVSHCDLLLGSHDEVFL